MNMARASRADTKSIRLFILGHMGRGWKWATVLAGVAVAVAVVTALLVSAPLDWRVVAGIAIPVGFLVTVAVLITQDSAERGRSGCKWLVACVLLVPVALPAFVVVAVYDRLHGRRGIEARWAPAGRWYLLGSLLLAVAAVGLAVSTVQVQGASVSARGASGTFSGSCSSALSVSLGAGEYGRQSYWPADVPPVLTAARTTVAERCSAAASNRMTASAGCLGAALLLALAALGMNRRWSGVCRP